MLFCAQAVLMERNPLPYYLKKYSRRIAVSSVALATSSLVVFYPAPTHAQYPAPETPTPSPTPTLRFDAPGVHPGQRIDQSPFTPIFIPKPVANPPEWTDTARVSFYCLRGETASQTPVRDGVIATDPREIPLGSRVRIENLGDDLSAEDTGDLVKGKRIDFWVSSCEKAKELGVMLKRFKITRFGW